MTDPASAATPAQTTPDNTATSTSTTISIDVVEQVMNSIPTPAAPSYEELVEHQTPTAIPDEEVSQNAAEVASQTMENLIADATIKAAQADDELKQQLTNELPVDLPPDEAATVLSQLITEEVKESAQAIVQVSEQELTQETEQLVMQSAGDPPPYFSGIAGEVDTLFVTNKIQYFIDQFQLWQGDPEAAKSAYSDAWKSENVDLSSADLDDFDISMADLDNLNNEYQNYGYGDLAAMWKAREFNRQVMINWDFYRVTQSAAGNKIVLGRFAQITPWGEALKERMKAWTPEIWARKIAKYKDTIADARKFRNETDSFTGAGAWDDASDRDVLEVALLQRRQTALTWTKTGNAAFLEGGISKGKTFELITKMDDGIEERLMNREFQNGEEFIDAVRALGTASGPLYSQWNMDNFGDGASVMARELGQLIDRGYGFRRRASSKDATKIKFESVPLSQLALTPNEQAQQADPEPVELSAADNQTFADDLQAAVTEAKEAVGSVEAPPDNV